MGLFFAVHLRGAGANRVFIRDDTHTIGAHTSLAQEDAREGNDAKVPLLVARSGIRCHPSLGCRTRVSFASECHQATHLHVQPTAFERFDAVEVDGAVDHITSVIKWSGPR